jgi:nucleoside-diphosphate-sugar epimerase
MVETWATEYHHSFGLPLIINRPGTIYGPGQEGSEESGWIAWFCKARDEGLEITINGDGSQIRDLLHVSDYVRLMLMQAENITGYNGRTYDVGGGSRNVVSVLGMAEYLGLRYRFGPPRQGDADAFIGYNLAPGWEPLVQWQESETLRAR